MSAAPESSPAERLFALGRIYYSGGKWRIEFEVEAFVAALGIDPEEAQPLIAQAMGSGR